MCPNAGGIFPPADAFASAAGPAMGQLSTLITDKRYAHVPWGEGLSLLKGVMRNAMKCNYQYYHVLVVRRPAFQVYKMSEHYNRISSAARITLIQDSKSTREVPGDSRL